MRTSPSKTNNVDTKTTRFLGSWLAAAEYVTQVAKPSCRCEGTSLPPLRCDRPASRVNHLDFTASGGAQAHAVRPDDLIQSDDPRFLGSGGALANSRDRHENSAALGTRPTVNDGDGSRHPWKDGYARRRRSCSSVRSPRRSVAKIP